MSGVDRTPMPCLHKIAHHEHGTRACYVLDKCRCVPCKDANRATERHRQRQQLYGRWQPYVDAEPVRQHILALRTQGLGHKRIATLAGVPHGSLSKLVYGAPERGMAPSKRVRAATADRILAVSPALENLGARTNVDATGTTRRLQALVAAGWSASKLAQRLGVLPSNFTKTIMGRQCSAATARAVRDLYATLAFTAPPEGNQRDRISVARSRNRARAAGWPPPMWWDEGDLDDPAFGEHLTYRSVSRVVSHEDVDEIAVEQAMQGARGPSLLTVAERREVVRRLHAWGCNDQEIQRRTGLTGRTALRIRQELGLRAVQEGAAA